MGRIKIVVSGLAVIVLLSCTTMRASTIDALKAEAPNATWDQKSVVKADVTCDGIKDTIILGRENDTVWIGVVPGQGRTSAKPMAWNYPIARADQGGFCARPVRIELYDHDCDTGDAYGKLKDCKPAKICKDFAVVDDECDPFNFYWNTHGEFSLWRA